MKSHPLLKTIPVAMWTIAEIEEYTKRSFHAGCSGIFTKPVDPVQMEAQVAAMLEFYWWAWSYAFGEADQERGPLPAKLAPDDEKTRSARDASFISPFLHIVSV